MMPLFPRRTIVRRPAPVLNATPIGNIMRYRPAGCGSCGGVVMTAPVRR